MDGVPPHECLTAVLVLRMQRVQYAKGKSDAIAKLDGTYKADKRGDRAKRNEQARGEALVTLEQVAATMLISVQAGRIFY